MTTEELKAQIRAIRSSGKKPNQQLAAIDPLVVPITPPVTEPPPPPPPQTYLAHDDCTTPDPLALWKGVYAEPANGVALQHALYSLNEVAPGRILHEPTGGPNGAPCRTLIQKAGDSLAFGGRTALGNNEKRPIGEGGSRGTFAVYHEGDHSLTEWVMWIDPAFPTSYTSWQSIGELKAGQPSPSGGGPAVFDWVPYANKLAVIPHGQFANEMSLGPVPKGTWFKLGLDCHFTSAAGAVKLYLDGTLKHERIMQTLKKETTGVAIPSVMLWGPYRLNPPVDLKIKVADVRVT